MAAPRRGAVTRGIGCSGRTLADGNYHEYTYDGNGNVKTRKDPNGITNGHNTTAQNLFSLIDYREYEDVVYCRVLHDGAKSHSDRWCRDE